MRAVDTVQRVAKVLGELDSMLAEFEWPVCPLRPWDSHFGAVALGNARPQKTIPVVEIVAQHMLAIPFKDADCFPA